MPTHPIPRRSFLVMGTVSMMAAGIGAAAWRKALGSPAIVGESPYGALGAPDVNGVAVPSGFATRLLATTGSVVAGTEYAWHGEPDGGACFEVAGGGWVYVSNSELNGTRTAAAGALRFAANGNVVPLRIGSLAARSGTARAGRHRGAPGCPARSTAPGWSGNAILSRPGRAPHVRRSASSRTRPRSSIPRPASSTSPRTITTAACIDSGPLRWGDLSEGVLEAAALQANGTLEWIAVSRTGRTAARTPPVSSAAKAPGSRTGSLYFCTTADHRVWAHDVQAAGRWSHLRRGHRSATRHRCATRTTSPCTILSGDIYVAEDGDDLQLVLLANRNGDRIAAPFLQLHGHGGSEIAGPVFSPDGTRLYFSSQRGRDGKNGMTFEVSGPFR